MINDLLNWVFESHLANEFIPYGSPLPSYFYFFSSSLKYSILFNFVWHIGIVTLFSLVRTIDVSKNLKALNIAILHFLRVCECHGSSEDLELSLPFVWAGLCSYPHPDIISIFLTIFNVLCTLLNLLI